MSTLMSSTMTPLEIVPEPDRHILGQHDAKPAVASAFRNRSRRLQAHEQLRRDIPPNNTISNGSHGRGQI